MGNDASTSDAYNGGALIEVSFGIDDYLIIPALIASLGQSALYIVLVKVAGVGIFPCFILHFSLIFNHLLYVEDTPSKLVSLQKGLYANQIIDFPFTVTPAKISILLSYAHIFTVRKFQILTYVVGFIVLGHGIGVFFAAVFRCSPIAYTWDKTIQGGSCVNQEAFYRYVSPPNILTDVLMLLMPLPFVWKLHTHLGQKLALTGVFLLGSLGAVTSILRMTVFFKADALTDPTWNSVDLGIWTVLEGGIIITAACLPSIWPLIARSIPHSLLTLPSTKKSPRPRYPSQPKVTGVDGCSRLGDSGNTGSMSTRSRSRGDLENASGRIYRRRLIR